MEPDAWMETTAKFKIDELESYLYGLCSDLTAVRNDIEQNYKNYNCGLAKGSVYKKQVDITFYVWQK